MVRAISQHHPANPHISRSAWSVVVPHSVKSIVSDKDDG
jgi:hypothetical protein